MFSILGTTYGGDGRTTLGLPDLRGAVPTGAGLGAGLPRVNLGSRVDTTPARVGDKVSLKGSNTQFVGVAADGGVACVTPEVDPQSQFEVVGDVPRARSVGINFIIALQGVYTSRS